LFILINKTSLSPPLSIKAPVWSQRGERLCYCVLRVSMLHLFTILLLKF